MELKRLFFFISFCILSAVTVAGQQTYSIKGVLTNALSKEPVGYANVVIWNTTQGSVTDDAGRFEITGVKPGSYRLEASFVGYKPMVSAEFRVSNKDVFFTLELEGSHEWLEEVTVVASPFRKTVESPLGLKVVGFKEIEKSAGGNRDISRVIQSFPGVASTAAFRNDLMVRGGGPSENRFFLDGVEIPTINHFSTQGASGGVVGIIDPNFIREVNFYSAAFPAARGNALSSVLDFKLRDGHQERISLRGTVGASEAGISADGPAGRKTNWQFSVRRSYLQFLFDMIGLPFLPTFNDAQFKVKHSFNPKNELTLLGIGAIDDMELNTGQADMSEKNQYILEYIPVMKQRTYTVGGVYKHYSGKNSYTLVLSRSHMNNKNIKYKDNDDRSEENLTLRFRSDETENKFRSENTFHLPFIQLHIGGNAEYATYRNRSFRKIFTTQPKEIRYDTDLDVWKWGLYATANYESYNERFTASFGIRSDANSYSSEMNKLLDRLSPRLSLSYRVYKDIYLNGSVGRYYELPPYITMGFKDEKGDYINKANGLTYILSDQAGAGIEYRPASFLAFTLEGFYKYYDNYPMSVTDSIPLASKGVEYGVLGNEEVTSSAGGRAYGLELTGRWYNHRHLTFITSYTFVRSEFKDGRNTGKYLPSAWDNRHLLTFSGTYSFPRNWDTSAKFRVVGGAPYTPYDVEKSSYVEAWDTQNGLLYDYSRFNSKRLDPFTQLDLRAGKTFYLKKIMFEFYIDIQNVFNTKYKEQDVYISTGRIINPEEPAEEQRYELKPIRRRTGTLLPGIGIMIEL